MLGPVEGRLRGPRSGSVRAAGHVILTSNLVFGEWNRIFRDEMATAAAIDRLIHHSAILEFDVPSFRAEEAEGRGKRKASRQAEATT